MARKPNFNQREDTYEYKVLQSLIKGTASKSEGEEVAEDIQKHLNTTLLLKKTDVISINYSENVSKS